ncbi:PREDICTED: cytochrome P450 3A2-like [Rhagoletis zephyria]|uniref:cytochrome P450 3A2-like n=1 Tax=Rhagoletis zephyria TaxID=28612 RepID=UPI0008115985|nr:PREDICTED: cytochrome P450 3A2-like [Rhagoletis zephyria]
MKRLYGAMAMETIIHVAFGVKVDSLADPTNPIIVYAKKSFQNDMSVTTFISIMAIILMPGVAEKLGIRYRGDITDFFRHFAEEIISQKKRELADAATLGTPKTTTSSSSSFLELLLEAEEEGRRQQQANKNDEDNEQPKMGKKSSPKHMSTDEMVGELADAATLGTPKTTTSSSSFLELLLEAEEEGRRQQQANKNDEGNEQPKMGKKSSPKHMSTDEMVSQCILFFLAGYETSSSTMCMAAYLLALHPQAQEKLHEEIISVTAQLAAERPQMAANVVELITFEDLPRFAYLSAVVDETLRLYAPATATERQASEDTLLQSTHYSIHVKKGDVVHIPIYSMHRDEEQFEQPEIFKPERFLPTTAAGDKAPPSFHRYSYLPFGGGPRSCVAMSLALREVKLALLHTVRLYKLSPCDRTKIPVELYYQANFITPKDIILKVEKR